jgi:hypothetical protein
MKGNWVDWASWSQQWRRGMVGRSVDIYSLRWGMSSVGRGWVGSLQISENSLDSWLVRIQLVYNM